MKRVKHTVGTLCLALGLTGTAALAWELEKPIEIIVGFSAGGGTDVMARTLATAAQDEFPVPLVIVNRAGASGVSAAEYVARQPADGYTLLVTGGSESTSVPNHREVGYDISEDFQGILRAVRMRIVLLVREDSEFASVQELVAQAKDAPGEIVYASSGAASLYHSTMLAFGDEAGIEMAHVPFKGGAETMVALLGGHVDVALASPDEAQRQIEAGKVRALAVTSDDRFPGLPDVPTLQEAGYDVYLDNMKGLSAPAGLPEDVYEYLNSRFAEAVKSTEFVELAEKSGLEISYLDGPSFDAQIEKMSKAIGQALD
jgi:tripartite-type tricarboxylate transporter receptor subunit TctC